VKAGADHPDIATETTLRATLLGARVAYSRIGASGIFFAQLIERMGIASEINAKAGSFRQDLPPNGSSPARLTSRCSRSAS